MYRNQSPLQKRLQSFAEDNNIELLSQTVPDLEARLRILKEYIGNKYAQSIDRPNNTTSGDMVRWKS